MMQAEKLSVSVLIEHIETSEMMYDNGEERLDLTTRCYNQ